MKLTKENIQEFVKEFMEETSRELTGFEEKRKDKMGKYATKCAGLKRLIVRCFESEGDEEVQRQLRYTQERIDYILQKADGKLPEMFFMDMEGMETEGMDLFEMESWFEKSYNHAIEMTSRDNDLTFNEHLSGILALVVMAYDYQDSMLEVPTPSMVIFSEGGLLYDLSDNEEETKPLIH